MSRLYRDDRNYAFPNDSNMDGLLSRREAARIINLLTKAAEEEGTNFWTWNDNPQVMIVCRMHGRYIQELAASLRHHISNEVGPLEGAHCRAPSVGLLRATATKADREAALRKQIVLVHPDMATGFRLPFLRVILFVGGQPTKDRTVAQTLGRAGCNGPNVVSYTSYPAPFIEYGITLKDSGDPNFYKLGDNTWSALIARMGGATRQDPTVKSPDEQVAELEQQVRRLHDELEAMVVAHRKKENALRDRIAALGCPVVPGYYRMACMENNEHYELVKVFPEAGILKVECPDLGILALSDYHNGLTDPKWRWESALLND